ncbi:MAG: hypothetical protein M3511_06240 [Deinococcota bacterium]|nr:hypothetical protein [Deinococcota bacterium]
MSTVSGSSRDLSALVPVRRSEDRLEAKQSLAWPFTSSSGRQMTRRLERPAGEPR